jgi:DNA-binding FadR family transcriptional regulator
MAYGPSPIKRDSVISQAAQEICRIIEAERLSPGDTLPPETRLSQMLGISRNSVREALRVLHGLGYVEKAAGRRVVVTAASQGGKSMFDESVLVEAAPIANEVRSHIAQKCAELSAERMTAAELSELERALAALEQAITRQDLAAAKAAQIRCWSRCSTRRRWHDSRTSRRSTRASMTRGISLTTGLYCARYASAMRARRAPWCESISRVSG